jgi:AraC family transcriptional regulator
MKLQPRIETLTEKRLVGQHLTMSLVNNRTRELWSGFMPHRRKIDSVNPALLYSLQVYPPGYFESFHPATPFEKWAALEVSQDAGVPDGMHELIVPGGVYAVFHYRGHPAEAASFFTSIFTEWLPASAYTLDARPHFELLGEKYSNDSADSEEEIWIPVSSRD